MTYKRHGLSHAEIAEKAAKANQQQPEHTICGEPIDADKIDTDEMFGGETEQSTMQIISELAEHVANEDEACVNDKKALTARQDELKAAKIKLYDAMNESGFQSVKLENGLAPSRNLTTKYFKNAGVDDSDLFGWLNDNNLGDIIKPTVHWGTLNSTMKEFVGQGHELPEIINPVQEKGIRMNGKSKFLANKSATTAE